MNRVMIEAAPLLRLIGVACGACCAPNVIVRMAAPNAAGAAELGTFKRRATTPRLRVVSCLSRRWHYKEQAEEHDVKQEEKLFHGVVPGQW